MPKYTITVTDENGNTALQVKATDFEYIISTDDGGATFTAHQNMNEVAPTPARKSRTPKANVDPSIAAMAQPKLNKDGSARKKPGRKPRQVRDAVTPTTNGHSEQESEASA